MEKHDIFEFTASNGVVVTAVVIGKIIETNGPFVDTLICYAQNRIFTYIQKEYANWDTNWKAKMRYKYGEVLVDYAILPDYDEVLKNYNPKQDVQSI